MGKLVDKDWDLQNMGVCHNPPPNIHNWYFFIFAMTTANTWVGFFERKRKKVAYGNP